MNGAPSVVIVDDAPTVLRLITIVLRLSWRCNAITVGTAEEALKIMETQVADLVIADVNLPGMSGAELAKQLRSEARLSSDTGDFDQRLLRTSPPRRRLIPCEAFRSRDAHPRSQRFPWTSSASVSTRLNRYSGEGPSAQPLNTDRRCSSPSELSVEIRRADVHERMKHR